MSHLNRYHSIDNVRIVNAADATKEFHRDDVILHDGKYYAAQFYHDRFICYPVTKHHSRETFSVASSYQFSPDRGNFYTPIDPTMTFEDIHEADLATDTGTHWTFHHTKNEYHQQHSFILAQLVRGVFEDALMGQLYNAIAKTSVEDRGAALTVVRALRTFREFAIGNADKLHAQRAVGHYHRNPHEAHLLDDVREGIRVTLDDWKESNRHYLTVQSHVESILGKLKVHDAKVYSTRAEIAAAAEAKAKAEAEASSEGEESGA